MNNIIEFQRKKDINYITGSYNEPDIVGVKGADVSIQFDVDLHNFIVGDYKISREELIAFVLVVGLYDDIKRFDHD